MSNSSLKLSKPPIVEVVLDIECDMAPTFNLASIADLFRTTFSADYPIFRTVSQNEHQIEEKSDRSPLLRTKHSIFAFQALQADEKLVVQIRPNGFSFNRLAPYTTLDDYFPAMEKAWRLFVRIVFPIQIRLIRLCYINRILLPLKAEGIEKFVQLDQYLKTRPSSPEKDPLLLIGFFDQQAVVDKATENQAEFVLTTDQPQKETLPIIFNITGSSRERINPNDWIKVLNKIGQLRSLNNRIFRNTLTEQCLNLFQQQ
jgi:uncharacterized protein (TIGR04255 family)